MIGPPGVGKSSIVKCIAELSGYQLVRINLSEYSELSDLLGSNLPVNTGTDAEDALPNLGTPKFCWCDGAFLKAMKNGSWVLLDELNLAPQSVLEGLNSCFDHRQRVYIPEIDQVVDRSPTFRIFCTQNPMSSGDGRKGLPQSFLSRLTTVYIKPLVDEDLIEIATNTCRESTTMTYFKEKIPKVIDFVRGLQYCINEKGLFGKIGHPWEFNIRDILRLFDILQHLTKTYRISCTSETSPEFINLSQKILSECVYLLCKSFIFDNMLFVYHL
jgi:midasin